MDIRNIISDDYYGYKMEDIIREIYEISKHEPIWKSDTKKIIKTLNKIKKNIELIYNSLFEKGKKGKKHLGKIYKKHYKYDDEIAINTIKKMYKSKNKKIEKKLIKINKLYIKKNVLKCMKLIRHSEILFKKYLNMEYDRENLDELKMEMQKSLKELLELQIYLFVSLIDMYFLRRFLDKEYITNAIIYGGYGHTLNYIYLLIKYFNFKITHYSYLNTDVEKFTKKMREIREIKNYENFIFEKIKITMIQKDGKPYQCSDISNFPKEFN